MEAIAFVLAVDINFPSRFDAKKLNFRFLPNFPLKVRVTVSDISVTMDQK